MCHAACRSPTEPRVHLLYRPGHYDILYLHPAPSTAGAVLSGRPASLHPPGWRLVLRATLPHSGSIGTSKS